MSFSHLKFAFFKAFLALLLFLLGLGIPVLFEIVNSIFSGFSDSIKLSFLKSSNDEFISSNSS